MYICNYTRTDYRYQRARMARKIIVSRALTKLTTTQHHNILHTYILTDTCNSTRTDYRYQRAIIIIDM